VVVHHTASPNRSGQFANDASYCAVGHQDAPVGNIVLGPAGECSVHAAGAANTQGKGGPWTTSRGPVPLDGGNSRLLAIEASNDGQGQTWGQADAYAALVAELAGAYGFRLDQWAGYSSDVLSHEEWTRPSCPGRKCDPAGPSPWSPAPTGGCSAGNLWNLDAFRAALGAPLPPPEEDDVRLSNPLVQATGADGSLSGAVYLTDGALMTYRWIRNPTELEDVKYKLRVAGLPDAIEEVNNLGAFGNLDGPPPT
jgi:hypothetical protein